MALFKSGNPALTKNTFSSPVISERTNEEVMTLQGTVNKCAMMLAVLMVAALYTWNLYTSTNSFNAIELLLYVGAMGGVAVGISIALWKSLAPYLALVYAGLEGLALGGLSALMEVRFPGIVIQALLLTSGIFAALLVIYKTELIKPTENFKLIVAAATSGLALYYLISMGLSFFNISAPLIHNNGPWGIAFSIFAIILASMNLVVDFDFIEQGVEKRSPRFMEWYAAFGLMVTVVWLYVEILRLLGKSRRK